MSAKVFKNKLIVVLCCYNFIALIGVVLCCYNFYCTDWFVLNTQSPPEQYVGDSVSLGQRVVSYPVNFVTGAINNLFSSNKTTDNKK